MSGYLRGWYKLALVNLKWAAVSLQLPIEMDMVPPLDSLLTEKSTKLGNDLKWVAYLQAAELLLQEKQGLTKALEWIEQSETLAKLEMDWNVQYYPKAYILGHLYWTKARINGELGNKKEALAAVAQMKKLDNSTFYEKEAAAEKIEQWIKEWEEE